MVRGSIEPPYRSWLDAWDSVHAKLDCTRSTRFNLIEDLLLARLRGRSFVLDLGAGPGTLTRRILERLPRSRVAAVEIDPALVRVGERGLRRYGARLQWIQADLREEGWEATLQRRRVDAVVSSLALHALRPEELPRLYRAIAKLLRRGGLFIDADWMPWGPQNVRFERLADTIREIRTKQGLRLSRSRFAREYNRWWAQIRTIPYLRRLVPKATDSHSGRSRSQEAADLDTRARLLRRAGFREAGVIWQDLDTRVLVAVR